MGVYGDHLGNIRLSYADKDGDGKIDVLRNDTDVDGDGDNAHEILEENNYYPFGMKHKGYNNLITNTNPALNYKFQGVEFNEDLGLNLYEMDVRNYDPTLGRFTGIDPVTHHSMSPYVAFDNNPIFWVDPSGADATDPVTNTVTSILSYVDKSNTTHITQTTTTTTTTTNDDGSTTVTYSSGSITNTVDAYGNVIEGSTVTTSSGTISKDTEGNVSSNSNKTSTRSVANGDVSSGLNDWTGAVSEYNKNNDNVYNVDMINKTSDRVTTAARAGVAVLSVFTGLDGKISNTLEKKLNEKSSSVLGLLGVTTSIDGAVSLAGDALKNSIGENNNFTILYGIEHTRNGALVKQMKTSSGESGRKSVGPTSFQDLWKGIKSIFGQN